MDSFIVADEAQLLAALNAVTGDAEIRLKYGVYDNIRISSYNPAGHVSIVADDPLHPGTIDGLGIIDSSNIEIRDLKFRSYVASGSQSSAQATVLRSHDVSFIHDEFMSVVDSNYTNDQGGLRFVDSSRVSVLDSKFHDLRWSLLTEHSDHVVVAGNDVRLVREGFDFTDVHDVTIDRNYFTNFKPLLTGKYPDHPDAIQFWTTYSSGSSNVEIINNAFMFTQHVPIQGIFVGNELGDAARHSNFVIDNNAYVGQSRHGISISYTDGIEIKNNSVISAPKGGSGYYLDPAINTLHTTGAVVSQNISALMFSTLDDGLVAENNIDAWDYYRGVGVSNADLFATTITAYSKPNALVAKAGSVADAVHAGFQTVDLIGNWAKVDAVQLDHYAGFLDTAGHNYQVV